MQNIFEQDKDKAFIPKDQDSIAKFKDEQVDVYRAALLKEEESVQLYKKLQETAEQETETIVLERLMQEEQKHVVVLENIIQMFNQVNDWVEAAEFNHQKPYWMKEINRSGVLFFVPDDANIDYISTE